MQLDNPTPYEMELLCREFCRVRQIEADAPWYPDFSKISEIDMKALFATNTGRAPWRLWHEVIPKILDHLALIRMFPASPFGGHVFQPNT